MVAGLLLACGCGKSGERGAEPVEPPSPVGDRPEAKPSGDAAVALVAEPPVVAQIVDTPLTESWQPVPGLSDAVDLETLDDRFCALRKSGAIVCWSAEPKEDDSLDLATKPLGGLGAARAIGGDGSYLCAADRRGRVACLDRVEDKDRIHKIPGLRDAVEVDSNYEWGCALTRRGEAHCWTHEHDQPPGKPVRVEGTPPLTSLQMDSVAICALDDKRQPWCWYHPEGGGARPEVSLRSCKRGVSYYPGDRDDVCTEAPPALVGPVQDIAIVADNELPELFYARIDGVGYFARDDTPYADRRPISKDEPFNNPPVNTYMERFPLPADTVRLVAEPDLFCAVTATDAVYCWAGPYGEMPRRTSMPSPVAVAINGDLVCGLTAAGAVHCAIPTSEE